jgi:hypothetical protein
MMNRQSVLSAAILGIASWMGACTSESQTAPKAQPASFDTPPTWLDRVSRVAYNPSRPEGAPALGDYENEPARFFFQGVPLMANEDDQNGEEEGPAAPSLPGDINSSQSFSPPG